MFAKPARSSGTDTAPAQRPRHRTAAHPGRMIAGARVPRAVRRSVPSHPPMPLAIVLGALVLLLGSCLNPPLEPQDLTVTLTASLQSATVGQEIRFRYESRGTNLSQTVVEYGNGDMELVPFIYTGGAPVNINSQAGHFDYAYDEPGTYVARAIVSTVPGASESDEVTVQITGS